MGRAGRDRLAQRHGLRLRHRARRQPREDAKGTLRASAGVVVSVHLDGTLLHRECACTAVPVAAPVKVTRFDPADALIVITARIWGPYTDKQVSLALDAAATQTHVIPDVLDEIGY